MAKQDNASLEQNNKSADQRGSGDKKPDTTGNAETTTKNPDPQSEFSVNALREEKRDAEADTQ